MSAAGALPRWPAPQFPNCDGCGHPNVKRTVTIPVPSGDPIRLTRTKLTYMPSIRDYAWLCATCRRLNRTAPTALGRHYEPVPVAA